jgi:hypothetical protein
VPAPACCCSGSPPAGFFTTIASFFGQLLQPATRFIAQTHTVRPHSPSTLSCPSHAARVSFPTTQRHVEKTMTTRAMTTDSGLGPRSFPYVAVSSEKIRGTSAMTTDSGLGPLSTRAHSGSPRAATTRSTRCLPSRSRQSRSRWRLAGWAGFVERRLGVYYRCWRLGIYDRCWRLGICRHLRQVLEAGQLEAG